MLSFEELKGYAYWGCSKAIVGLLWVKYYAKKLCEERKKEHVEGSEFDIRVVDVNMLYAGFIDLDWKKRFGERTINMLQGGQNILWNDIDEDSGGVGSDGIEKILVIDFTIDDDEFRIMYSWGDRWEYPIIFPPYSDKELDERWKDMGYKHSVLVAEVNGEDVTEHVNKLLGPMGDIFKGRTCAYKGRWITDLLGIEGQLSIIDNEGNDYEFGDDERVVFGNKN